jgi:lysophospholipase L1-like esterase
MAGGPAFAPLFKSNVKVLNYAKNGATLESLSATLDELIKQKPDYILVQFGHNDMKEYDAAEYGRKLKDYVERITKGGSKGVVLRSVTRRNFGADGKIAPVVINGRSLPEFAGTAEKVAKDLNVAFIDLNTISIAHHNKIGVKASAAYNPTEKDKTHFSKEGAKAIATLIADELRTAVPELAAHLR